jgi:asparagine synthase (glutamine-hydrolysing)
MPNSQFFGMATAADVGNFGVAGQSKSQFLTKTDRATMMNSLESRAIFLDNDLVEFCRRLPRQFKYRNGQRKYLLRRVAETLLPRHIVERPKKEFGIPIAQWLKSVPAEPPFNQLPGVSADWARKAWQDHRAGRADHRLFLWCWLSLQNLLSGKI